MDIDFIFLIMLLVFYVVSRLGGKKKQQQQRKGPAPSQRPSSRPERESSPELDDALREIREALGWPSTPQPNEEEPATVTSPPTMETTRETTSERYERPSRPAPTRSKPNARSTQRQQADTQEAAFAEYTGVDAAGTKKSRLDLPPPVSPTEEEADTTHPILRKLRSREGAQQAVIMAEVFEPRWRRLKS